MARTKLPRVRFEAITTDQNIECINHFLQHRWAYVFPQCYPKLGRLLKGKRSRCARDIAVYTFFRRLEDKVDLAKKARAYQRAWDKINDRAMAALAAVVEADWPAEFETITAHVAFNPICPRHLGLRTFDLWYEFPAYFVRRACLHELLHFIYFEKWKRVFPRTPHEEFDTPHLVWRLSEMVPRAVLGDRRVQRVEQHDPMVYPEFYSMQAGGRLLLDQLQRLFDERRDFADFLRKAYAFVRRHRRSLGIPA